MLNRLVYFFWVMMLLAGLASSAPVSAAKVMIVGDSLSDAYSIPRESGWVHLLSERLGEAHEV
ncbi:MAG: hypothetical protein GVY32_04015, partial [Gammaproteobacteria bacterium]|nr:hypothetical protein [Gammaproteobacteria bacterium]